MNKGQTARIKSRFLPVGRHLSRRHCRIIYTDIIDTRKKNTHKPLFFSEGCPRNQFSVRLYTRYSSADLRDTNRKKEKEKQTA